jgi:hypothetical protein
MVSQSYLSKMGWNKFGLTVYLFPKPKTRTVKKYLRCHKISVKGQPYFLLSCLQNQLFRFAEKFVWEKKNLHDTSAWQLRGYFPLPIIHVSLRCPGRRHDSATLHPARGWADGRSQAVICLALDGIWRHKGLATQNSLSVVTCATPVQDGVDRFWPRLLESFCYK